jgi:hypothetical protein
MNEKFDVKLLVINSSSLKKYKKGEKERKVQKCLQTTLTESKSQ